MARIPQLTKGKTWTLRIVDRLRIDGDECWGDCNWDKHEIHITKATARSGLERSTLAHELVHRCCPWMNECLVLVVEDAIEDAIENHRPLDKAIARCCPWMRPVAVRHMAADIAEAMELADRLFK